jgi:hypothetical protein
MSDGLKMVAFRLDAATLARLDECAEMRGLQVKGRGYAGQPNRSEALREAVKADHARLVRARKKSRNSVQVVLTADE